MRSVFSVTLAALLAVVFFFNPETSMSAESNPVTLEWYGHSCFLLTLKNGAKILMDPYDTTRLPYSLPKESVDLTFSTHDHFDHNAVKAVPAKYILRADGREAKFYGSLSGTAASTDGSVQVDLRGAKATCMTIPSFHDDHKGSMRGANGIIRFTVEGLTFVHLGDLGDTLSAEQINKLKPVDVLLVPVGGYYTIDAAKAQKVVQALSPKVVIPMHYKTDILGDSFPISTVDAFLEGYQHINRLSGSTATFQAGNLPNVLTIEVFKYHGQK